jgi:uncharacterized membrane protein YjjP (DUF1212 family)
MVRAVVHPVSNASQQDDNKAGEFIIKLGSALHSYGTSTPDLEFSIARMMKRLGLEGHFFAQPTGLFISIGRPGHHQTSLMRVEPGEVNLEKLELLNELARRVADGRVLPVDGIREVDSIVKSPPRYGKFLVLACYGLSSAAVCRFLGGGWREISAAGVIGALTGILALILSKKKEASFLLEPAAAAVAASLSVVIARAITPISLYETILAGVIAAIPGMTLTTAMLDLATRNLVAGTSRLTWAVLIFIEVIFGVAIGYQTQRLFKGSLASVVPIQLAGWTEWLALIVAPLSLSVRFNARPRNFLWITAACILAYGGSRFGASLFDWRFGGFAGAVAASMTGELFCRITKRPPTVVIAPSIVLLVPGTIGFGSVSEFFANNPLSGVEAAFDMLLIAISIVIGVLVSQAILPRRRGADRISQSP